MTGATPTLVILAAGRSARLGTCKALVELPGGTPLARLFAAGGAVFSEPLCISGAHDTELRAAALEGLEVLENVRWRSGRTSSVQTAVLARPGRDLVIAPVDVPCVPELVFRELAEAWRAAGHPARGWLAPRLAPPPSDPEARALHGHPVILGRDLCGALTAWPPDRPLRELRALADPLLSTEVEAPEILDDLDTSSDLERLRRRLAGS